MFRACGESGEAVARVLRERGATFFPALLRPWMGHPACHIVYEPALPGFRAAPDDLPVTGLRLGVDPVGFIGGRKPVGDTLDIARAVLPRLRRPLDVTLTVHGDFPPGLWDEAVERHFGATRHRISVRAGEVSQTHPWAQDYIKAGQAAGRGLLMTPRRLYEGRPEEGELYRPLLEGLQRDGAVASRLSWDGGDVQFVRLPGRPDQLLLAHGGASRDYWGGDLTRLEHSFVLATEFGADQILDLSAIGPHADYLVAFLPLDGVALVSEPVHADALLFESATRELLAFIGRARAPRLGRLVDLLDRWDRDLAASRARLQTELAAVRLELGALEPAVDEQELQELFAHADRICPGAEECAAEMFAADPELLRRAADMSADVKAHLELVPALLALMEAQLGPPPRDRIRLLDEAAEDLRGLGFRVIRVPYLNAPALEDLWPGVAYVNFLAVGRDLFVPQLGLGDYESAALDALGQALGRAYRLTPVHARAAVLGNGGVHCAFGIIRGRDRRRPTD